MKPLDLQPTYRRYLIGKGALSVDYDRETLVGLTPTESVKYLTLYQEIAFGHPLDDLSQLEYFLELGTRHEAALPMSSFAIRALEAHEDGVAHATRT